MRDGSIHLQNYGLLTAQEFVTPVDHAVGELCPAFPLWMRYNSVFDRTDDPGRTVRCLVGTAAGHPVVSGLVVRREIAGRERDTAVFFIGERQMVGG